MLVLSMMMMFIVVMMDINKVAINKLLMDITVDNSALLLGSMISSEAKVLSASSLDGGAYRQTMLSDTGVGVLVLGILLIVVVIVIYIIICIATYGGGLSALGLVGLLLAAIIGGLVAWATWLIGEYSRQQGLFEQWGEAIATLPNKNSRYRETTLSTLMPALTMDSETLIDIHDYNRNSDVSDDIGRFNYWYSYRMNRLAQSSSTATAWLSYNCGGSLLPEDGVAVESQNIIHSMLTMTDLLEIVAPDDGIESDFVNPPPMLNSADIYESTSTGQKRLRKGILDLRIIRDALIYSPKNYYIQEKYFEDNYSFFVGPLQNKIDGAQADLDGSSGWIAELERAETRLVNAVNSTTGQTQIQYQQDLADVRETLTWAREQSVILAELEGKLDNLTLDTYHSMNVKTFDSFENMTFQEILDSVTTGELQERRAFRGEDFWYYKRGLASVFEDLYVNPVAKIVAKDAEYEMPATEWVEVEDPNDDQATIMVEQYSGDLEAGVDESITDLMVLDILDEYIRANSYLQPTVIQQLLAFTDQLRDKEMCYLRNFYPPRSFRQQTDTFKQYGLDPEYDWELAHDGLRLWNSSHDRLLDPEFDACGRLRPSSSDSVSVSNGDPNDDSTQTISVNCRNLWRNAEYDLIDNPLNLFKFETNDLYEDTTFYRGFTYNWNNSQSQEPHSAEESSTIGDLSQYLNRAATDLKRWTAFYKPIPPEVLDESNPNYWQVVHATGDNRNNICSGQSCSSTSTVSNDDSLMALYLRASVTTPKRSYLLMSGQNGHLQSYYHVNDPNEAEDADWQLRLRYPNLYKIESLMNQFAANETLLEHLAPIVEPLAPNSDGSIATVAAFADPTRLSEASELDISFYTPMWLADSEGNDSPIDRQISHNPNHLQLSRSLRVTQNIINELLWPKISSTLESIESHLATMDSLIAYSAIASRSPTTYNNVIKPFLYKKYAFQMENLKDIQHALSRFAYKSGNTELDSYHNSTSKIWNTTDMQWDEAADAHYTARPLNLGNIGKEFDKVVNSLTKIRQYGQSYKADDGEAIYVWRDAKDKGGKWHIQYGFVSDDIPYPSIRSKVDKKFSYTMGYTWMDPFCKPSFDSYDRPQSWNCNKSQSAEVKAARFDEPDLLLGWPMFSSLRDKDGDAPGTAMQEWQALKNEIKEYLVLKGDMVFLNEIDGLEAEFFYPNLELEDGEAPPADIIAEIERMKSELRYKFYSGQILTPQGDPEIFYKLRAFLVNYGVWSRARTSITPEVTHSMKMSADAMSWEDYVYAFVFHIPPLWETNPEWTHYFVDWNVEIDEVGSDCGEDDEGRCDEVQDGYANFMEKLNAVFKLLAFNSQ